MHLMWYRSAFTRATDLARNLLTLFCYQGAMEPALGLSPYGLTVPEELFFLVREKPEMRDVPHAAECAGST